MTTTFFKLPCVTIVVLLVNIPVRAQQLHAIILHDANPAIEYSASLSGLAVSTAVYRSVPHNRLVFHKVGDGGVNRRLLLEIVDRVRVGPHDSIFLYYCGHGYMNQRRTPYILPGDTKDPLYLKDLLLRIKRKRAMKAVVFFDCCQSLRPTVESRPVEPSPTVISPLFQSIFFDDPSDIPHCIISSAPGEFALAAHVSESGLTHGSVFSVAFSQVVIKHREDRLSWEQFRHVIASAVATEFRKVRDSGVGRLGNRPLATLSQKTQTVTEYRAVEVR